MGGYLVGCVDGWLGGWMDEWMNGWMDMCGWMDGGR